VITRFANLYNRRSLLVFDIYRCYRFFFLFELFFLYCLPFIGELKIINVLTCICRVDFTHAFWSTRLSVGFFVLINNFSFHSYCSFFCNFVFSLWRFGLVGNVVGRIGEVTQRRARLVLGWATVCRRVNHIIM